METDFASCNSNDERRWPRSIFSLSIIAVARYFRLSYLRGPAREVG